MAGSRQDLRRRFGATLIDGFFRGASRLGRLHPLADPRRHGVEVERDLVYVGDARSPSSDHRVDLYIPREGPRPLPVVLYVHGGGFRILSKDTHWLMALAFARQGYLVANINYRLAPRHPFPAAALDVAAAYAWLVRSVHNWGGDPQRIVLAGESAGANLATVLTVASCWRREEPYARAVFDLGVTPKAVVPNCGIFQVSDSARFGRRRKLPSFIRDRLHEVEHSYLGAAEGPRELADPLVILEHAGPPERPLPPFFTSVGTADPILDDTRRLQAAITRLGGVCEARYYRGEPHAFQAFVMRRAAQEAWAETFAFLRTHVPPSVTTDRAPKAQGAP